MNVRMVMNSSVITADVCESLREAATRMRSDGVSALPVMNAGELVGIVTERDIVTAVVNGLDLRTASVAGCMTAAPASASPEDPVSDVAFQMVMLGARHVPVVEGGRLIGMLSARDLLGFVIPGVDTDSA